MESDRLLLTNKDDGNLFKTRTDQIESMMFWRVVVVLFSKQRNYERGEC